MLTETNPRPDQSDAMYDVSGGASGAGEGPPTWSSRGGGSGACAAARVVLRGSGGMRCGREAGGGGSDSGGRAGEGEGEAGRKSRRELSTDR